MAALPDGAIVVTTYWTTIADQTNMSVFTWKVRNGSLGGVPDYVVGMGQLDAQLVASGFQTAYLNCLSTSSTLYQVTHQPVYPTRYTSVTIDKGLGGLYDSPCRAMNVSGTIVKRSEFAKRWGRGVLHMPAVPDEFLNTAYLSVTGLGQYQTFAPKLKDSLTVPLVTHFDPVLWSYKVPGRATPIISVEVQTPIRIMNRRTVRHGI